jgi:hypothetical protein
VWVARSKLNLLANQAVAHLILSSVTTRSWSVA